MPKVLVLLDSTARDGETLADAIAEGAREVRFTEVDVRVVGETMAGTRHRALDHRERLADYDAVVIVPAQASERVAALLDRSGPAASAGSLVDRIGSAFAPGTGGDGAAWPILSRMGRAGMILVAPLESAGSDDSSAARALGRRVAKLAEWVRHAKGHEAHDHHGASGHHHHH